MKVKIYGSQFPDLELFPENEEQEIVQNILCIIHTMQGSCPGLRDYGIDPEIFHKPVPVAKAAFAVSINRQLEKYEQRATLTSLEFEDDPKRPNVLFPILEVTIP